MLTSKQLGQIGASLAKLGPRRLAILCVVGVAIILSVGISAQYLSRPTMQAIYTGLTAQDVTRMTSALAEAGVTFDVNEQRSAVLVPFGQAARARSLLAQKGLPSSSKAGYELFDQMGSMGLTSFMQEVTRVRALEGEIGRTIQALDGVAAARVHLVLPEAVPFRRERREPSASVLLRIDSRWQTSAAQAVRHIVAAAVPGMKVEQVSVASTDGRLMASGGDERNLGSLKLAEMERSMASELEQRAGRTLATALGAGNFQVSITVHLDVDRLQTNETVFDPKSRVERSVRVVKQSGSTEDGGAKSAVGVEANLPRAEPTPADGDKRRQREDRREELINYELNTKSMQTVREGYRVQRLAVAVVVNRKQIAAQLGTNPDSAAVNARLEELKRLVAAATGAGADGTANIEISANDFMNPAAELAPIPSASFYDYLLMNLGSIVNAVAMVSVVTIVVLFGLLPLTRMLLPAGGAAEPKALEVANGPIGAGLPAAPNITALPSMGDGGSATQGGAVGKRHDELLRERLQNLVASDEAKVARVLKTWMAEAEKA
jgi:flagellar M-ring protein FliF